MAHPPHPSLKPVGSLTPSRIAATYVIFATLWIILSDRVAQLLASSLADEGWFQTLKGLFFVSITGLLLLVLVRRLTANIEQSRKKEMASMMRFRTLIESSPDGIAIIDPSTAVVLESNEALDRILLRPHGPEGRPVQPLRIVDFEAVESPEQVTEHIARVLQSGADDFETRWKRFDGEIIDVSVRASSLVVDGRPVIYAIYRDLSDRRAMERRVAESENRLSVALEAADLATWDADLKTGRLNHSPRVAEMFGLPPGGQLHSLEERLRYIHPDDRASVLKNQEAAISGEGRYLCEARVVQPEGAVRWILARAQILRDEHGNPSRAVGVLADVTERKLAEESLRKSEERYRLASRSVSDIIWDWDVPANLLDWSEAVHTFSSAGSSGQFAIEDWINQIHADDRERVRSSFYGAVHGDAVEWREAYRLIRANGTVGHYTDRGFIVRDASGRPIRMVGAMSDVTSEHEARELLVESELRYRLAAEAVSDTIWDWDMLADRVTKSGNLDKFPAGPADREHSATDFVEALHPDDRVRVRESLNAALESGAERWGAEYRHRLRNGGYGVFIDRGFIVRDVTGRPTRMVGAMSDVTAQREAEAALRSNQERLAGLIRHSPLAVIEWDADFRCTRWDGQAKQMFGWSSEEIVGRHFGEWRFVYEDDIPRVAAIEANLTQRHVEFNTVVNRNYHKSGHVLSCEWHNANLYDNDGRRVATISLVSDATEREAMLARLAESEERFRKLAETIDQSFWIRTVSTGEYLYQSPAAARILGVAHDQLPKTIAQWRKYVHPDDLAQLEERVGAWVSAGYRGSIEAEYRIIRPDGQVRWLRTRGYAPTPAARNSSDRILGTSEDVTSRKLDEQTIRRNLEIERLLLQELDHRVKNALAGLLTMISLCAQSENSVAGLAGAMQRRVSAMASVHEMLSSQRWTGVGISELIAALTPIEHTQLVSSRGPNVRISPRQATPLGIVLQELFSNSLKYGALSRPQGRITIEWKSAHDTQTEEQTLLLEWIETGGPPIEQPPTAGLGTSLVQGFARSELRGEATLTFPRAGAHHTIRIRLDVDSESDAPGGRPRAAVTDTILH